MQQACTDPNLTTPLIAISKASLPTSPERRPNTLAPTIKTWRVYATIADVSNNLPSSHRKTKINTNSEYHQNKTKVHSIVTKPTRAHNTSQTQPQKTNEIDPPTPRLPLISPSPYPQKHPTMKYARLTHHTRATCITPKTITPSTSHCSNESGWSY